MQTDQITADGLLYQRDGVNYLVVEEVVANWMAENEGKWKPVVEAATN